MPFRFLLSLILTFQIYMCFISSSEIQQCENRYEHLNNMEENESNLPESCNHKKDSIINSPEKKQSTESSSQALVLYDDTLISPFHKDSRSFIFAGKNLTIQQDWRNLGVAAVVWDAALVMCEFLERHQDVVENKNVIEIGAGSGIVGLVASIQGGRTTITDREMAIPYLEKVLEDNSEIIPDDSARVEELDWTKQYDCGNYDVILGADIIYIEDTFNDLLKTLKCLCGPQSVVYLSCRFRYDRDPKFINLMKDYFSVEQIMYDKSRDVRILKALKIKL